MRNELINLNLRLSKFFVLISIITSVGIFVSLSYANITKEYSLIILLLLLATIIKALLKHCSTLSIKKVDLLLYINTAILWQVDNKVDLGKIKHIYTLGFVAVVITLEINKQLKRLLIFYDNVPIENFKQLMRYAKWHGPKNS